MGFSEQNNELSVSINMRRILVAILKRVRGRSKRKAHHVVNYKYFHKNS
jgi:hypothetical protein